MNSSSDVSKDVADRQWFIVRRWQAYAGELRALVIRAVSVVVLYGFHLVSHFGETPEVQETFAEMHRRLTIISVLMLVVSLLTLLLILKRVLPGWLAFLTTAVDLLAVTAVIASTGGPMRSALMGGFFLVIAMAGLRFDLRLVWFATLGSMAGFMAAVGIQDPSWFDADHVVPVIYQQGMLVCLAATGLVIGQIVRLSRPLAEEYHARVERAEAKETT
ncbi:hypothetical protein AB1L30_01610 [Bremerella sp. JC817]|uniref:hypothetical protein n=1 Tax=Bremerella sp. JC817 TaxID=3231756 RepID=UPI003458F56A